MGQCHKRGAWKDALFCVQEESLPWWESCRSESQVWTLEER
jgi:hypothetical protein